MGAETEYRIYLNMILQKKFLLVAIVLAVCTFGVVGSYLWPEEYEARSTVFIEKSVINALVEGIAVTPSIEGRLKVLTHTLASRNLLQKVVDDLDVDLVGKDPASVNALIKDFQKKTAVTIKDDDLFIIQYANADPRLARDYVNTLIRKYIEEHLSAKRQESYGANRFLSEQMEHFRSKIQEAENRLVAFKQQNGYVAYVDDTLLANEIRQAEANLEEVLMQKTALQARRAIANRASVAAGAPAGATGDHLGDLQRRREQLLLVYTEDYPEVQLLTAEIEQLRKKMKSRPQAAAEIADSSIEGTLLGIEARGLQGKEANLRRLIEEKKAALAQLPEMRKVYDNLLRDRDTYKNTYDQLVLRYGKSELSKQMEIQDKADTFRIVDPAILPEKPARPNRVVAILLSLAAGLGVGFGSLYLLHYFDDSVKTIDAVQEIGIPVLALVPQFVTTEEKLRQRQQTMSLGVFVAVYLLGYTLVLGYEILQMIDIPVVDRFLRSLPFAQLTEPGGLTRFFV